MITTGTMTKGRRFITGTSSCSYLVQEEGSGSGGMEWLYALIICVAIVAIIGFGVGLGSNAEEL